MSNLLPPEKITVKQFYHDNRKTLKLKLLSGKKGFKKEIHDKDVHRPGLALAGFVDLFTYQRIQICGNTEIQYLKGLTPGKRDKALHKMFPFDIPCIIVTEDNDLPSEFIPLADEFGICVFLTPFATTKAVQLLAEYLDEHFAPKIHMHGSLVDVYGIGILFTGRSGIGKSEVALDLVARGHRLVADDVVLVYRRTGGVLIGMNNETLRYNMEIRGLGIIDIHAMFGIRGIRKQKRLEVQVELVDWDESEKYERLGIEEIHTEILSERVTLIRLPIYPGKNISMIVEVIALNQLLKSFGYNAAKEFEDRLTRQMNEKITTTKEDLNYQIE